MHRREEITSLGGNNRVCTGYCSGRENRSEAEATDDAAGGEATGAHAATEASTLAFRGFLAVVLAFAFSLAFKISRDGASA